MKKFLVFSVFAIVLSCSFVARATHLDIGAEVRMKGIKNPPRQGGVVYPCRNRLFLTATIPEKFSIGLKLQDIGWWGSQGDDFFGLSIASHTCFIENAYLKINNIFRTPILPLDITVGRQSIKIGDGIVLDDDHFGFDGLRVGWRLPWKLKLDGFVFKPPHPDTDIWGLAGEGKLFGWVIKPYIVEISSTTSLAYFGGLRVEKPTPEPLKGASYKFEICRQFGNASPTTKYGGLAYLVGGILAGEVPLFGCTEIYAELIKSSGDEATLEMDERFFSPFAHRRDGLEKVGFGEYFAAEVSNIWLLNAGIEISPFKKLSIKGDYFAFTNGEETRMLFGTLKEAGKEIGGEYNLSVEYRFFPGVVAHLIYAQFAEKEEKAEKKIKWKLIVTARF